MRIIIFVKPLKRNILAAVTGALTGLVNGFFGGGGGMLVVPALTLLFGLPPKSAHATAIAVILPITVASGISYAINRSFPIRAAAIITAGVVAGGIIGSLLLKVMKAKWIPKLFAAVILAAGIKLLFF